MTHVTYTDLSTYGSARSAFATATIMFKFVWALVVWVANVCSRNFLATVRVIGRSTAMAYVDPFAQPDRRPDH
jgi:hypothetical protein